MPKSPRFPKQCLHRPSGQAIVYINRRPIYLGRFGSKEADDNYLDVLRQLAAGAPPPVDGGTPQTVEVTGKPVRLSMAELMDEYRKFAEQYYRRVDGLGTTREYTCIMEALRPLKALFLKLPAAEFGPRAMERYIDELIHPTTKAPRTPGRKPAWPNRGYGRRTANNHAGRVRRMFRWAVAKELVPPSIVHSLSCVSGLKRGRTDAKESSPRRPVPVADIEAIRPFLSPTIWAMVQLQLLSGHRPGELVIMRPCDIDTSRRVWWYIPTLHKNSYRGQGRRIPIGPKGQMIIKPFMADRDAAAFLFSPRDSIQHQNVEKRKARKTKVQPSQLCRKKPKPDRQPGERYSVDSYRHAIERACTLAGVEIWTPHQLRKNAGTNIREEDGLDSASKVLGHRSVSVTEDYYAEVTAKKVEAVMLKIG